MFLIDLPRHNCLLANLIVWAELTRAVRRVSRDSSDESA